MVSFWPWKTNDSSPASFEKALARLSAKIQQNTIQLDSVRQQSRRFSVLWILYAGFAYLLCTIILVLVVGWREWGPTEYSMVGGSPVLIYLVRLGLTTVYDYRISTIQLQVDDLQKQRDMTIKKLKSATKYDSTQELLKKYGGTPTPKSKPAEGSNRKTSLQENERGAQQGQRTRFAPPPTANIPGRLTRSPVHSDPRDSMPPRSPQQPSPLQQQFSPQQSPTAEFAPNAFPSIPQYAPAHEGPHWYDRFVDALLGEDESLAGKRLALICNQCRLVNGQAPPGVKRLEDIGKWRCGGCGATNGEENDVKNIVEKMRKQDFVEPIGARKELSGDEGPTLPVADEDEESDVTVYTEDGDDTQAVDEESKDDVKATTRSSTRLSKDKKET